MLAHAEGLFSIASAALYLAAMLLFWWKLFLWPAEKTAPRTPSEWGIFALWLGAVVHLLALAGQGPTLFMVKAGVAGLFGWILVVTYLMIGRRLGLGTGAVVTPVALAAVLYSLAAPPLHLWTPADGFNTFWLASHVIIVLGGYVALAFAFAASLLYLLQETLLKRKKLTGLFRRLPSLQVADEWIGRATAFGLALLTMGIVTGVFFGWWQQPDYVAWRDPKVVFSVLTWLLFAFNLVARWRLGWHGRRSHLIVIYGFVLMVFSFLGTSHSLQGVGR